MWVLVTASLLHESHLVPGDPVRAALGLNAPAELVEARRTALGLDQPLFVQYFHYIGGLFTGDMGTSMITGQPVSEIISTRLPATLQLALLAVVLVLLVSVPLGVDDGRREPAAAGVAASSWPSRPDPSSSRRSPSSSSPSDSSTSSRSPSTGSPVAGNTAPVLPRTPRDRPRVAPTAVFSRIIRVEVLSVLSQDFIRTARAKRLAPHRIYSRHALPNAMTATLTLTGLLLTGMVAGTVLVENVFAWPGLGTMIVAIDPHQDYSVVQGIVLVYGIGVLIVNLVVDVVLALLDPRSTIREA